MRSESQDFARQPAHIGRMHPLQRGFVDCEFTQRGEDFLRTARPQFAGERLAERLRLGRIAAQTIGPTVRLGT